jgi:hypothetical protein
MEATTVIPAAPFALIVTRPETEAVDSLTGDWAMQKVEHKRKGIRVQRMRWVIVIGDTLHLEL